MRDRGGWDGRELSRGDSASSPSWEGGSRNWLPWVFSALIPIGLGLLWLSLRGDEPSPPPSDSAVRSEGGAPSEAPPEDAADIEEVVKLPPLSESDSFLREVLGRLSSHPFLALLLDADDLVRKMVVSVANVAEAASPAKQLLHVRPEERFAVLETTEGIVVDPARYRRYDTPRGGFGSL